MEEWRAWDYTSPAEAARAHAEAGTNDGIMFNGYFNQDPADGFRMARASQRIYADQVKAEERKIMPVRVLREYFKSIFWPMKFTDRELEEARVEKGKRDEENREKDRR